MRKTLLFLLSIGALAVAMACADLPSIAAGQCGNRVLEPGEDCDTFPLGTDGGPGSCIAPGQPGQCHYACDPSLGTGCPATFSCGADSVCRRPSGAFRAPFAVAGEAVKSVLVGDFDGDFASDVVAVGTTATRIYFFDGQSQPKPIPLASSSNKPPALGRLASDARTSAVVVSPILVGQINNTTTQAGGGNLRVWRGSPDRTLLPTIYPGVDLTKEGFATSAGRMVPAFVVSGLGSEIMAIGSGNGLGAGQYGLFDVVGSQSTQPKLLFANLGSPDGIKGEIPVADLGNGTQGNGFTDCQAIVLAYVGATKVGVYATCTDLGAINFVSDPNHKAPALYDLGDTISGRAFLVRAQPTAIVPNPNMDLFVATSLSFLKLAGQPDGSFSAPTPIALVGTKPSDVLAVGYLNGDAALDWVDPSGIHINGAQFPTPPLGGAWTDARMGDFNGNGKNDVVALSPTGLDFYNGSGFGLENGLHIPVDGTATELAVGDFDGDFVADFAVTTTGDSTGLASNGLLISFGKFTGFPDTPVSIGRLDALQQLSPAFFDYRLTGSPDFISTLFAIGTTSGDLVASTLQGSPDRLINSPFFLGPSAGSISDATVGDFASTGHLGLAGLALVSSNALQTVHLWSTPATGDAQLDATHIIESSAAAGIDPLQVEGSSVVALDIGGAPGDELVAAAPSGVVKKGTFVVAALGATDWSILDNETLDGYPTRDGGNIVLLARDVDGDGKRDLLLAYREKPFPNPGKLVVKVLFDDQSGQLSLASAVTVDVPAGTVAVTTIHASADGSTSLAAVTHDGIFLAPVTGRTIGTFEAVAPLASSGSDGGVDRQPSDIATGDVDGDGVDDLIVGSSSGFIVYFGVAVVP